MTDTYAFNQPNRILAIQASAIGQLFSARPQAAPVKLEGNVAVVDIVGPVLHNEDPCFDSYDAIKSRIKAALASTATCLLLNINSPGGLCDGLYDNVLEVRAMAAKAGKPIYTYVDSTACSAAYIYACASDYIFIPPTGLVGSIGLIEQFVDITAKDEMVGEKYFTITSGARKADRNPHTVKSTEELQVQQAEIDSLAETFFGLVAQHRPITVEQIRALQAGTLYGQAAINAGLADQIATYDQVIDLLNSGTFEARAETRSDNSHKETNMKLSELKQALVALADDEKSDEKDKAEARKMLTSLYSEETPAEEKKDEPAKAEAPTEDHKEPDGDEPKKEEPEGKKAIAALTSQVIDLQKSNLLASRPDFTAEQIATLKKEPLSVVKFACANLPKPVEKLGQIAGAIAAINAKPTVQTDPSTLVPVLNFAAPGDPDFTVADLKAQVLGTNEMFPHLRAAAEGSSGIDHVIPPMTPASMAKYLASKAAKQA